MVSAPGTKHQAPSAQALLREGTRRLREAGCESPDRDAEWLLGHLLNQKPTALYLHEAAVSEEIAAKFLRDIVARASGAPVQYLTGEAEFFGERFAVAPGGFIPRPETETGVEAAVHRFRSLQRRLGQGLRVLDLGTGSGCIAVTLAKQLSACTVVAVEVSWTTLCVAVGNVRRHGLSARVQVVCGRWMEPLRSGDYFDGIISNPPYVPTDQVDRLPLNVRQEPRMSLDGGEDGLRDLRQLVDEAPRVLRPGGFVIVECAEAQVAPLARNVAARPWVASVDSLQDLAGRPRGLLVVARAG